MNAMHSLHVYCQVGVTIRPGLEPTVIIVLGTLDRNRPKFQESRAEKSKAFYENTTV